MMDDEAAVDEYDAKALDIAAAIPRVINNITPTTKPNITRELNLKLTHSLSIFKVRTSH
jgi:hypothetical protein